ncbi:MAG TPA: GtrA family protein [Azospirillaceae bacterium]|nr:GtrA family protein [Azospirillaceae bacterium]
MTSEGAAVDAAAAGRGDASPLRQILTFGLIGVGGAFVDMAALWAAIHLAGLNPYAGRVVSFLVAATFTWWMNRTFTFRDASRRAALRQWARFIAANSLGGVVNYAVFAAVVAFGPAVAGWILGDLWQVPGALWPFLGVAAGSLAGMVFNFVLSKLLVFRRG